MDHLTRVQNLSVSSIKFIRTYPPTWSFNSIPNIFYNPIIESLDQRSCIFTTTLLSNEAVKAEMIENGLLPAPKPLSILVEVRNTILLYPTATDFFV